jgi:hypothetical protein
MDKCIAGASLSPPKVLDGANLVQGLTWYKADGMSLLHLNWLWLYRLQNFLALLKSNFVTMFLRRSKAHAEVQEVLISPVMDRCAASDSAKIHEQTGERARSADWGK